MIDIINRATPTGESAPVDQLQAALARIVLGERQLAILTILSRSAAPLDFAAIHRRLTADVALSPSTTSSLLQRMHAQGLIRREGRPGSYLYRRRSFGDAELLALLPRRYHDYLAVLWHAGPAPYQAVREALAAAGSPLEPTTVTSTLGRLHGYGLIVHDVAAHTYAAALSRAELLTMLRSIACGERAEGPRGAGAPSGAPSSLDLLRRRLRLARRLEEARAAYDAAHLRFRAHPDATATQAAEAAMQQLVAAEEEWHEALSGAEAAQPWQLVSAIGAERIALHSADGPVGEVALGRAAEVAQALAICQGLPTADLLAVGTALAAAREPAGAGPGAGWRLEPAGAGRWQILAVEAGRPRTVGSFGERADAERVLAAAAAVALLEAEETKSA